MKRYDADLEILAAVLVERQRCIDIVRNSGPYPVLTDVLIERMQKPNTRLVPSGYRLQDFMR